MKNFKIRALDIKDACDDFIASAKNKDIYVDHYKTKYDTLCLVYFCNDEMHRIYLKRVHYNGGEWPDDDFPEIITEVVSYNERYSEHGTIENNKGFTKIKPLIKLNHQENVSIILIFDDEEDLENFIYEIRIRPLSFGHYKDSFSLRDKYIKDEYAKFTPECEKMTLLMKLLIIIGSILIASAFIILASLI